MDQLRFGGAEIWETSAWPCKPYSRAMKIEPSGFGYLLLARALEQSGHKAEAQAAIQQARSLGGVFRVMPNARPIACSPSSIAQLNVTRGRIQASYRLVFKAVSEGLFEKESSF